MYRIWIRRKGQLTCPPGRERFWSKNDLLGPYVRAELGSRTLDQAVERCANASARRPNIDFSIAWEG
jgi:hypothetical protein